MKKFTCLFLSSILVFCLCGCGNPAAPVSTAASEEPSPQPAASPTEEAAPQEESSSSAVPQEEEDPRSGVYYPLEFAEQLSEEEIWECNIDTQGEVISNDPRSKFNTCDYAVIGTFTRRIPEKAFFSDLDSGYQGWPAMVGELSVERVLKGDVGEKTEFIFVEGLMPVEDYLWTSPAVNTQEEFQSAKEAWEKREETAQVKYVRFCSLYSTLFVEGQRYLCLFLDGAKWDLRDYPCLPLPITNSPAQVYAIDEENMVSLPQDGKTVTVDELIAMLTEESSPE